MIPLIIHKVDWNNYTHFQVNIRTLDSYLIRKRNILLTELERLTVGYNKEQNHKVNNARADNEESLVNFIGEKISGRLMGCARAPFGGRSERDVRSAAARQLLRSAGHLFVNKRRRKGKGPRAAPALKGCARGSVVVVGELPREMLIGECASAKFRWKKPRRGAIRHTRRRCRPRTPAYRFASAIQLGSRRVSTLQPVSSHREETSYGYIGERYT